jgi:DNA mismatch endonuclease (patch repair protein)
MRAIRRRDSKAERALRSVLHRRGYRFRVDLPVAVEGRSPRPDVVFTRAKVAIFVDGCFWHGCSIHGGKPKKNATYWNPKIARNIERDRDQTQRLAAAGWRVLRFWEHDDPEASADQVEAVLTSNRALSR